MKICPRCNKTYTDENLNFCLDDGSVLSQMAGDTMPETVMMNQPRPTQPEPSMPGQQAPQQPAWNIGQQPQPYSMQPPKKSSKTWIWVLLILGVVVLLCGGGAAVLVLIGLNADTAATNTTTSNKGTVSASPGKTTSSLPSSPPKSTSTTTSNNTDRNDVEKVDLSEWVRDFSAFGETEMSGTDFIMASKQKGYYYVLAAPADTYQTEMANTSITLQNINSADSRLGYGLVFHSNPTPLQQGYAFLIDSKKKKYRVVHHSPQKEETVVTWTKSDLIKDGSQDNTLEVRDLDDKVELYINGEMVTSIKNIYGYKGGVVGLYSGDAAKIAFRNLEVRK